MTNGAERSDESAHENLPKQRQRQILQAIENYFAVHGCSPSSRDIAAATGLSSPSTVLHHLRKLKEGGYVFYEKGSPRTVRVLRSNCGSPSASDANSPGQLHTSVEFDQILDAKDSNRVVWVPFVGRIAAGSPIPPLDSIRERYPLPREIVGTEEGLFLLKVIGDSMTGLGIFPGDWVVVRRMYEQPKNGDVVAAIIVGVEAEGTVKTYMKLDRRIWLMPQNSAYMPLPGDKAIIHGKVVAVLRQM